MVRPGAMREKAVFQRLSETLSDEFGNVYSGWAALTTRSVDFREQKGRDRITGGVLSDVALATMRVRSDSTTKNINTADRVIARGITWAIKDAMQVDAKNTVMEFVLEKGVAP